VRSLADAWRSKDEAAIKKRLDGHGRSHGRVLYFVARPPSSSSQGLQREAAALLSNKSRKSLQIYLVCFREGLVSETKTFGFLMLCMAARGLARQLQKPLQVYLGREMDAVRMEERLRGFSRASQDRLSRRQREMDGAWLESAEKSK
jgi:hypothetical protein